MAKPLYQLSYLNSSIGAEILENKEFYIVLPEFG
jgi:hypothetical protein